MKSLEKLLLEYSQNDYYGFHMPGHKRNSSCLGKTLPYNIDITEIDGFDDLHHAEEILLEGQKKAAKLFRAEESFYLINGSTVGNLSAIMAVTNRNDKILVARNNHKSVYNAIFLNDLKPVYVYPKFNKEFGINGEISKDDIEQLLNEHKDIKAVVIVSPTYDGVISDIRGIAKLTHRFNIPLIVDEAHGSHLGMHPIFSRNSNENGADIVVHSVHKTLPSLTQTALLHVNGKLINRDKLKRYLKILQSSSPSYVLMSSIDTCVNILQEQGDNLFETYVLELENIRNKLLKMKCLKLIETENFDKSKILISTRNTNITSEKLYNLLLDKYHLQLEMCGANYVTAMTSISDTKEGFHRLTEALYEIDQELIYIEEEDDMSICLELPRLQDETSEGKGSEWFYYLYPPGIPLVVPGEIVTKEIESMMKYYKNKGFTIRKG